MNMSKKKIHITDEKESQKKQEQTTQDLENQEIEQNEKSDSIEGSRQSDDEEKLTKELEDCQKKLSELNDKYLRLAAEYDNYRKRTLKEKMDLAKTAAEEFFRDILPVVDNFERALESLDKSDDINAVKEGIHLIYNSFKDFLKNKGVTEIEALNKPLDTDLHEAVGQAPAEKDEDKGKVVQVVQKGYKLHNKVLRHAKVIVAQ